jgi:ribosomal protein L23
VKFRVSPKMNKFEMKEWIEGAYDTPVKKVNTANYEGKVVRRTGGRYTHTHTHRRARAA